MSDGQGRPLLNKCKVYGIILLHFVEGDMLGAMANAIEESDVILMCMSERYRDSQNCRSGMCTIEGGGQQSDPIFLYIYCSPLLFLTYNLCHYQVHTLYK